jgi:hypothetical protein
MTADVGMGGAPPSQQGRWPLWWTVWAISGLAIAVVILAFDWSAPRSILLHDLEAGVLGMVLVAVLAVVLVFAAKFAIGLIVLGAASGIQRRKSSAPTLTTSAKQTRSTPTRPTAG